MHKPVTPKKYYYAWGFVFLFAGIIALLFTSGREEAFYRNPSDDLYAVVGAIGLVLLVLAVYFFWTAFHIKDKLPDKTEWRQHVEKRQSELLRKESTDIRLTSGDSRARNSGRGRAQRPPERK